MYFFLAACFGSALAVALAATTLMVRIAPSIGLVDLPSDRKVHTVPTPLGGGVSIWVAVVVPLALGQAAAWLLIRGYLPAAWLPADLTPHLEGVLYRSGQMWAVVAGGTVLTILGLLDDLRNLPWAPRLAVQALVAIGLVAEAGVRATVFVPYPWVGSFLSVLWILVLINAFNFLDNMDGLSSGIALISSILFAAIMLFGTSEPHWLVGGVLLVLAGALAGFLCFNWPPARIFMGDSGSYFIGLMLACATLLGTFYEFETSGGQHRHVILAPVFILAVPLYDFASVILIRLREGRSPFHPDKSHFSHRLVQMGFAPRDAVLTIHLATLTTGLGGLLLYRVHDWLSAVLIGLLIGCVLAIVGILETIGRNSNGAAHMHDGTSCTGEARSQDEVD